MSISEHLRDKVKLRVLELFEKGHSNNDIKNLDIKQHILDKLLPYQTLHTFNMINAVRNNTVSFDGSYMGTGKTYTTAAVCAQLGYIPFVICPKSIISVWKRVLTFFGVDYIAVINYECIRELKYKDSTGQIVPCPYIKKNDNGDFEWDFSRLKKENIIMIFDEVHNCKSHRTLNGRLLLSCRERKTIMLSGTLCDKINDFAVFGLMLGFYKKYEQGRKWLAYVMREDKNQYSKNKINSLNKYLFPDKGSRMSLEDLGKDFPMNQISVECLNLNPISLKKINEIYEELLATKDNKDNIWVKQLMTLREKIENYKVDLLFDLALESYEQDKSIALFVNYRSTFNLLTKYFDKHKITYAEIHGDQDDNERENNIDMFQKNIVRIIISTIQSGGVTLSLHDLSGKYPRVSIISPSFSRIQLTQTLGRIYRAGCKSPCLQKIVYCADTYEEHVAKIIDSKKEVLD